MSSSVYLWSGSPGVNTAKADQKRPYYEPNVALALQAALDDFTNSVVIIYYIKKIVEHDIFNWEAAFKYTHKNLSLSSSLKRSWAILIAIRLHSEWAKPLTQALQEHIDYAHSNHKLVAPNVADGSLIQTWFHNEGRFSTKLEREGCK